MNKHCYKQRERIKKNEEIRELKKTGKTIHGRYYYIIYRFNNRDCNRIAALVSKRKLGAVKRNYERRLIREIYRLNKEILVNKVDILIIKKKNDTTGFKEKQKDLKILFQRTQP